MDISNATRVDDQLGPAFAVLESSLIVQCVVAIAAICVCTRIWSSHVFRSIKYGKGHNILPPTLPYWIPGLRHALSMAYDSHGFLAKCMQVPKDNCAELSHRSRTDVLTGMNTGTAHPSSSTAQARDYSSSSTPSTSKARSTTPPN